MSGDRLPSVPRVAIATLLLALISPGSAAAATYRAHDGASLLAAAASANASSTPSTIELSAGTFLPASTVALRGTVTVVGPAAVPAAKLDGGAVSPPGSDLLLVGAHARVSISNVELTGAGGQGAGAAIDAFGAVDLESSTIAGNSGPGLLIQRGATAAVRNSTLSDGLDVGIADIGTASLLNATVAANATGGVDDAAGTLRLTNSIVAKNGSSDCTRPAATSDHSLDGDGSCGVGALARTDPLLERLAANGGPTLTRALRTGSPAIDAGDNANCPPEDQRHFVRVDGHCDVGAYEVGAVPSGGAGGSSATGGPGSFESAGAGFLGVSARGAVRGAGHSRVTFLLRALVGHPHATFRYADPARRLLLRELAVTSLTIDARRGVATVRGSCVTLSSGRRVGTARRRARVSLVLTSHNSRRTMRISLSNGYAKAGGLLSGRIVFLPSSGRSARVGDGRLSVGPLVVPAFPAAG